MDAARIEKKLLINAAGSNTIRIIPPLIVTAEQIEDGLNRLRAATQSVLAATAMSRRDASRRASAQDDRREST
jgi:acetylornithine/succinyldiaminopimelate/putrescine aminotransferase